MIQAGGIIQLVQNGQRYNFLVSEVTYTRRSSDFDEVQLTLIANRGVVDEPHQSVPAIVDDDTRSHIPEGFQGIVCEPGYRFLTVSELNSPPEGVQFLCKPDPKLFWQTSLECKRITSRHFLYRVAEKPVKKGGRKLDLTTNLPTSK